MRGIKLGKLVDALRQRKDGLSKSRLDALEALGFDWGVSLDENWRRKVVAMKAYKDIHGHLQVPQRFVVPTDDQRWPEETRGMKLGRIVDSLRCRQDRLPQYQVDALAELGLDWGFSPDDNWRKNLLALTTFGNIYGHLRVPRSFVVPTDTINNHAWPEGTEGIKLGHVVSDLRRRKGSLPQNRIDALNFFGFEWKVNP